MQERMPEAQRRTLEPRNALGWRDRPHHPATSDRQGGGLLPPGCDGGINYTSRDNTDDAYVNTDDRCMISGDYDSGLI